MRRELEQFSKQELSEFLDDIKVEYLRYCDSGLKLDMSRGKPSPEQLDLGEDLLNSVTSGLDCISSGGIDCRNYGGFWGISELRDLFSDILNVPSDNILIGGNSSLSLMFDTVARAMLHGVAHSERPWSKEEKVRFICPVPGYDRHYRICEVMGIEMIPVPLTGNGPDMDLVEKIVSSDASVKGMWVVPIYSNPTGDIYSEETLSRLAKMDAKANDFTLFVDNAYPLHTLNGTFVQPIDFFSLCNEAGHPDRPIMFSSTSKITFAAGGVSCIAMSKANMETALPFLQAEFICHDKVNQLRHVKIFPDLASVKRRMLEHADILAPKFRIVDQVLHDRLDGFGVASWNKPTGGYFISLVVRKHTAQRVVDLCRNAGLVLTQAGAGFPHDFDPDDRFIRLAPSFPSCDELKSAAELLSIAVLLASCESIIGEKR